MKVLHVESGKHFYGGARQVAYIMEGLSRLGVHNILACPTDSAIAKEVQDYATVYEMPMTGDADFGLVSRLKKVIKQEAPQIVHLHSRRGADTWGGIAASQTKTPCILSRRVDNPEAKWLVSLKYRLYDHVITISEAIARVLISEGVSPDKITCVRSAVDPTPYLEPVSKEALCDEFSLPKDAFVIGIVAQLIQRKGHRYLIDAVSSLKESYPQLRVLCFGQGPLRAQLENTVKEKKVDTFISFVGFRHDLPKWLGGLDLLVHPADMEGLGVSLLQASAAKVPIIATNAGGLPEAVLDQVTGLIIPPNDTLSLTKAMKRLIDDETLRKSFGKAGQSRILDEFSVDAMAKGNLAVYQKVLAQK